jgi:hypothetical protein
LHYFSPIFDSITFVLEVPLHRTAYVNHVGRFRRVAGELNGVTPSMAFAGSATRWSQVQDAWKRLPLVNCHYCQHSHHCATVTAVTNVTNVTAVTAITTDLFISRKFWLTIL